MSSILRFGTIMGLAASISLVRIDMVVLQAGEETVVAAEEEAAVVVDGEGTSEAGVVADEDSASAGAGFRATPIEPHQIDGRRVYFRQSSDAFADPDQRTALEPKYYFRLDEQALNQLEEGSGRGPAIKGRVVAASAGDAELTQLAAQLQAAQSNADQVETDWLDYEAKEPRLLVVHESANAAGKESSLAVIRTKREGDALLLSKLAARRVLSAEETGGTSSGVMLDTCDIPAAFANKAMFLSRVIAIARKVSTRWCVDFYGSTLNPESDCRVWLTDEKDPLGQPVAIRFTEIMVKRESGAVAPVSVLGVLYQQPTDKKMLTAMGIDFPLCRPAIMAQMAEAQANKKPKPGETGLDLKKIVGADLLDEFAHRLVNGTYK